MSLHATIFIGLPRYVFFYLFVRNAYVL